MNYIEFAIQIPNSDKSLAEIVSAFLSEAGFDGFTEENGRLFAYVSDEAYDESQVDEILSRYKLSFTKRVIAPKDWNAEWEKNFTPTVIDDLLTIRAPFHRQDFPTKHTICIEPKMSFGTGHHATTVMMCKLLAHTGVYNAEVLDFGCGTGVLAIYAALLGAKNVTAIDIDEWAFNNTIENARRNNIDNIVTLKGDIAVVPPKRYNLILANINLNVLKKDIPTLGTFMQAGDKLLLSGFLLKELDQIINVATPNLLTAISHLTENEWAAVLLEKK